MARPLKLKACKDSGSGKCRVNVPPRVSPSGRRERRFFDTSGAADAFIEKLKCRRDNLAAIDRTLAPAQLLDAAAALDTLSDYPQTTLLEAARGYLEMLKARAGSITLGFERFTEAKKHKSKFYLRDIKWVSDRLRPVHTRLVSSITHRELAAALGPLPDSSRNHMLRTLRALFRFGHDLGYLQEVPVWRNDFAPAKRTQVEVLPVEKIRRLIEAALKGAVGTLPRVRVLHLETWIMQAYGGKVPLLVDLMVFLRSMCFRLFDLGTQFRKDTGLVYSIDACFMNEAFA
jgi:hypothetical protein